MINKERIEELTNCVKLLDQAKDILVKMQLDLKDDTRIGKYIYNLTGLIAELLESIN